MNNHADYQLNHPTSMSREGEPRPDGWLTLVMGTLAFHRELTLGACSQSELAKIDRV
jgi:hypothetical protein